MVNTFDSQTSGITTDRLQAEKAFSFSLSQIYGETSEFRDCWKVTIRIKRDLKEVTNKERSKRSDIVE